MRTFLYPARFDRGNNTGVLVITFRDVPEAITQGNGEGDALWQAGDCLEEAIAGRIADGREIPKASRATRGERLIPVPARTHRLSVYDAAYLELAQRERLPLATLDADLRRAAAGERVALLSRRA